MKHLLQVVQTGDIIHPLSVSSRLQIAHLKQPIEIPGDSAGIDVHLRCQLRRRAGLLRATPEDLQLILAS